MQFSDLPDKITMNQLLFYWTFHKSTLTLNWIFSVAIAMVMLSPWMIPLASMTGGPLISLLYKEVARKNDYYFYFNRGLSKRALIVVSLLFNVATGILLLILIQLWTTL
ncbi:MAG TPA: hypothetical protein DCR43_09590 [Bacteroidales bacterium]|nr:MAG: hypothetical protein A2X11_11425 [Bacteroidetes bacterium GWE2_42_24]OFY25519.1 MAG: hypothetical protein A2X09_07025 [Bacteroidetes bacterium GWF2_43_11]PKP23871.1 MAG: hypothetical protein CVU06_06050 [Bacteroidetes bacterium HGW-Bacteroidetes-22]HAQ66086.1 hypothetical protein [Bacteroidales bacterium]HBZ66364.1 hypothetical protein [Bacteroidales bacterium]